MIYPDCDLNRWCVEGSSYIADADNYYTKYEIDEKLKDIEESGCCITEEEVDEKISAATSGLQETLVAGDNISISGNVISAEVPSLSGYATEQWVSSYTYSKEVIDQKTASGGGGSIDAYTKVESDARYAFKTDLNKFVTVIEFNQYITNLQQQINSLINTISGCCGSTGETEYRWITMTGDDDYTCSGTTKMTKEKQQSSTDGITWTDTGQYRTGSTVLEENSVDCGYVPTITNKLTLNYINGDVSAYTCDGSSVLRWINPDSWENVSAATIGDCITEIGNTTFEGFSGLTSVSLPNTLTKIGNLVFSRCSVLPEINIPNSVTNIGIQAFSYCLRLSSVTLPSGVTELKYDTFYRCESLTSVTLSSNLTTIGEGVFGHCAFSNITIPSSVTSIGQYAFSYNNSLVTVTCLATTPPSLDGTNIFIGSNNLSVIYVPSASVNAYKTAQYWSQYADRIQAIP